MQWKQMYLRIQIVSYLYYLQDSTLKVLLLLLLSASMLVDPRPYTYEYRTLRLSNPTFQSSNIYGSMYNRNLYKSTQSITPVSKIHRYEPYKYGQLTYAGDYGRLERNKSGNTFLRKDKQETKRENPEKFHGNYKLPGIHRNGGQLSDINLPKIPEPAKKRHGFQCFNIYEGQQKPFDIINWGPREQQTKKLRNYPKLTMEDKLIERGIYRTFNQYHF